MVPERYPFVKPHLRLAFFTALLGALAAPPDAAWAFGESPEQLAEFRQACREARELHAEVRLEGKIKPGTTAYFPLSAIGRPAQNKFSFPNLIHTGKKEIKDSWGLRTHNGGTSNYPLTGAVHAIAYEGLLYIYDGHHQFLDELISGSSTTPVHVLEDWTGKFKPERFELVRRKKYLSYLQDSEGRPLAGVDWCEMENDVNVELARLLIYKVKAYLRRGKAVIVSAKDSFRPLLKSGDAHARPSRPLVIKINGGLTFEELIIADALTRAGVIYDGQPLDEIKLNSYLEILKAYNKNAPKERRLVLVDQLRDSTALRLADLVAKPLAKAKCALALTAPPVIVAP